MTEHNIWGSTPHPGSVTVNADGGPNIRMGDCYYAYGTGLPTEAKITGGRVWTPVGTPATIRIMLFMDAALAGGVSHTTFNLDTTPVRSVEVPVVPGGWTEARWDPQTPPPVGYRWMIGYEFVENDDVYLYFVGSYNNTDRALPKLAPGPLKFCKANADASNTDGYGAATTSYYKIGANSPGQISDPWNSYGTDTIIDDAPGSGPEVPIFGGSIVSENELAGTPQTNWLQGVTSEELPAFGRSTYVEPGGTIGFSIDYNLPFTFDVFRLGHYQGGGARMVSDGFVGTPTAQPAPVVIPGSNGAVTCEAWSVNAEWEVPLDAVPGWYQVLLRGTNGTDYGYVLFMVSDAAAKRPTLIVTGDATWHAAYNGYGGNNVYGADKGVGNANNRAFCSTYDKPVITRDYVPQTHFFNNSYPYLKWSERMGYEAGVATIEQIKNDPSIMDGRDLIVFTGHNEYIPDVVYTKVEDLLAQGQRFVNAAANDFFWRVKFTDGAFSSATNGRVMWCKKDTMDGPTTGPDAVPSHNGGDPFTNENDWTGTWQDTRWALRRPSEDTFGDRFVANGLRSDKVTVYQTFKFMPAWRDCPDVQSVELGASYEFAPGTLGMEWDSPIYENPNVEQIYLTSTEVDLTGAMADVNGENYGGSGPANHGITLVKSSSGYILNLNSDQWSWALDGLHLRGSAPADPNAMQMMLNVIRDLGVSADNNSITAAGLTVPLLVDLSEYGFLPPPIGSEPGMYYSDGFSWTQLLAPTPQLD